MFTKKHFINTFSVLFLLIVNIIFLFEYSSSKLHILSTYLWLYIPLFFVIIWFIDKILKPDRIIIRKNFILLFLLLILLLVAFEFLLNMNKGNAYFASSAWLTSIAGGTFPYTNTYSFNLPFLYYLEAPFYLLGNLGLFGFFGLTLFLYLVMQFSYTKKEIVTRVVVLLILPAFYFELLSGGNTFTNAVLVIAVIFLMNKFIDDDKINIKFLFLSIVFGVLLCTRLLILIPFLLSLIFFFRYNLKNLFLFFLIALFTCIALLIPFIRWNHSGFIAYGLFTNNFANLPVWIYILLFIAVVYTGWMISDLQELLFSTGMILFFISLIEFLGNTDYSNELILSIPFLILSIKEYEVDKFLGKKIPIK